MYCVRMAFIGNDCRNTTAKPQKKAKRTNKTKKNTRSIRTIYSPKLLKSIVHRLHSFIEFYT